MNRLQQKCVIVSAGLHLLLVLILFIGPAFLSSKSQPEDLPVLDFVPSRLVDAAVMGGGNPAARPPAPAPLPTPPAPTPPAPAPVAPPPKPAPEPVKPPEPSPPKDTVKEIKEDKLDPESLETAKERKARRPEVSTTPVVRKPNASKDAARKAAAEAEAREQQQVADARRRAAGRLMAAAKGIREGASSATTIEEYGPGGGGPAYASYGAWVKSVYENAWVAPEDTASDDAVTRVTVTIASDGTVVSARISRPSGDTQVDRSVQRTLDRVRFIAPFPEGAKEKQRTYNINFNLKAKRLLG